MSGPSPLRGQWVETGMGLVVLAIAAIFLTYALDVGDVRGASGGYALTARFGQVGALSPGAKVRVAGVKVGAVSQITLDPQTYQAVTRLDIDPGVRLPADSTAKITSDGLLGGAHVAIAPGGVTEMLADGGEIENTQGAVDLFGLIGQVIRPQPSAPAGTTPSAAAPGKS